MPSSLIDDLARHCAEVDLPDPAAPVDLVPVFPTLLDCLALVADHRDPRGIRHSLAVMLAISLVAVLCGARSLRAIMRWARAQDQQILLAPGVPDRDWEHLPADTTLGRALRGADADQIDDALTGFTEALTCDPMPEDPPEPEPPGRMEGMPVDGKAIRGAKAADGTMPHLVAAFRHETATVAAQRAVRDKSNEITVFAPLLDSIDHITGLTVVTDALHTQRDHATYLHGRGAFYLFPVKGNQPGLFTAIDALPWEATPIAAQTQERNRGREKTRHLKVLPAPADLPFPHATQVLLPERTTTGRGDGKTHCIAELGVTSVPTDRAGANDLLRLTRGHWGIEALHHVRDVTYRQDASRARTGQTPKIMATLRNTAISLARLAGWKHTPDTNDHYRTHPADALRLCRLTS
jgi:predicted transposase YbfD/YdcC